MLPSLFYIDVEGSWKKAGEEEGTRSTVSGGVQIVGSFGIFCGCGLEIDQGRGVSDFRVDWV